MLAADLDGNNHTDLVIDFGPGTTGGERRYGVWVLFNGTTWFQIDPDSAAIGKAFSSDDGQRDQLAIYFTGSGSTWIYTHSTPVGTNLTNYGATDWFKVSALPVKRLGAADLNADNRQDLIIDFGSGTSNGLWKFQKGVLKQINTKTTHEHNLRPVQLRPVRSVREVYKAKTGGAEVRRPFSLWNCSCQTVASFLAAFAASACCAAYAACAAASAWPTSTG